MLCHNLVAEFTGCRPFLINYTAKVTLSFEWCKYLHQKIKKNKRFFALLRMTVCGHEGWCRKVHDPVQNLQRGGAESAHK
jgi:hypothetical protein